MFGRASRCALPLAAMAAGCVAFAGATGCSNRDAGAESARATSGSSPLASLADWDSASDEDRRATAAQVAGRVSHRFAQETAIVPPHKLAVFRHKDTGLDFVLLPPIGLKDAPVAATIARRAMLVCRTEVTQAAWMRIMGPVAWAFPGDEKPVHCVRYSEVGEFCRRTGLRLPTAEEWQAFYGDALAGDPTALAWFGDNSQDAVHDVRSKGMNRFGLYSVPGNVWEWTSGGSPADEVTELRGGSFLNTLEDLQPSSRWLVPLSYSNFDAGFRPVSDVDVE